MLILFINRKINSIQCKEYQIMEKKNNSGKIYNGE